MRFLAYFAVLALFAGFAFAQPVVVPTPGENPVGWASEIYKFLASKEWGLFVGALTVGVVWLLKKFPTFGIGALEKLKELTKTTIGGWILNAVISVGSVVSTALLAKQAITVGLILGALAGVVAAAGTLEAGKDLKAGLTK